MALLAALMLLTACKKENDEGGNEYEDIEGTPVMISGDINTTVTEAAKVIAISSTDRYKTTTVTSNHFTITLDNGKPWGIIFLNSADQILGVLSLDSGIETIPLHYITAGVTAINLQTITRNGNIFTPAHNPIGNEIILTPGQKEAVGSADDYLAMLLKNPDVNGNGQVDILEGKFFKLSVIYFIHPGNFEGGNLTPTIDPSRLIDGYKLFLSVEDNSFPETVYYTGPAGSPLANSPSESYLKYSGHRVYQTSYLFDVMGTGTYLPVAGNYTINYAGQTLTFNLPDQSYVLSNVVYPRPTIVLNSNNTMNKVDWAYQYPSGVTPFDLNAVYRTISFSASGTGNKCSDHQYNDRLYDVYQLPISTTSHTLTCQNIDWGLGSPYPNWNHIDRTGFDLVDHYGATYAVINERTY